MVGEVGGAVVEDLGACIGWEVFFCCFFVGAKLSSAVAVGRSASVLVVAPVTGKHARDGNP